MLSRSHRFHGHASLRYVYQHGQSVRSPLLTLKYSINKRRSTYRCAVVVSRKVNKSAVIRNRIRRRIYEQLRELLPASIPPYDLVFTVFGEQVASLPAADLTKMIQTLLVQANVMPAAPAKRRANMDGKERA